MTPNYVNSEDCYSRVQGREGWGDFVTDEEKKALPWMWEIFFFFEVRRASRYDSMEREVKKRPVWERLDVKGHC